MNERLRRSAEAMAAEYPGFVFRREHLSSGSLIGVWEGEVQPVKALAELDEILDDLHHERLVRVVGGEIVHHPECAARHCRHRWLDRLVYWRIRFHVKVAYDGTKADPRCWVLSPPVNVFGRQKHVWRDGSICPFLSSTDWDADRDDVAEFMGHAIVWLLKWTLWDQTGVWIGREHQADPEYHLNTVRPHDPCWCRSAVPYTLCHLDRDRQVVEYRRRVIATVLRQSRRNQERAA
jgi:hypothetical protein